MCESDIEVFSSPICYNVDNQLNCAGSVTGEGGRDSAVLGSNVK